MPDMIRIVIADDHPVFRAGMQQVLSDQPDFEVLAEAGDGEEALSLIRRLRPDVAVLDVDMPLLNGVDAAESIDREKLPTKVIILTVYDDEELMNHVMERGALGYILKDNAVTHIARCIRSVSAGKPYISPTIMGPVRHPFFPEQQIVDVPPGIEELTPAEQRVLALVARNKTSTEIGRELFISPRTVDHHRSNICEKLGLHGQYALVRFALEHRNGLGGAQDKAPA